MTTRGIGESTRSRDAEASQTEVAEMKQELERQAAEIACLYDQVEAHERENEALHRRVDTLENRDVYHLSMASAAHSFNNLLTIVQCHLHLLESGDLPIVADELDSMREAMVQAKSTAQRLLRWNEDDIAVPLAVNEVVQHVALLVRPRFLPRIPIAQELAEDLPRIVAPRFALLDALVNVAMNARDAMERGVLTLRTRVDAGHVVIEVIDTGRGMDPETRARIFEPRFSTKRTDGRGIGLMSVTNLFTRVDGGVCVTSEEGVGTTFALRFPAAPLT